MYLGASTTFSWKRILRSICLVRKAGGMVEEVVER